MKLSELKRVKDKKNIRNIVEKELDLTGGIFRLAPAWVARPGIIQPGRRIKLADIFLSKDLAVNERWLASTTYADNGVYNAECPEDHGLSYLIAGGGRILLRDALAVAGDLLLGGRKWDVLPKFFDNLNRIPHHLHPCQDHVRKGLKGKPESYYFPLELNLNRNAFPSTPFGVDSSYSDARIMDYLESYFRSDNRLTDLANTINLVPGTGWFMPPCTLHAPGSLVTYELQAASDVTCIPESRVNDMPMPPDLLDRDIPVTVKKDGFEKVCKYILSMIRCRNSGNTENFRREYFRPPLPVFKTKAGSQHFVIYGCGKSSARKRPDLYSAKKTSVKSDMTLEIGEKGAFGAVVLGGHGSISAKGKKPVSIESVSVFPDRDTAGGDEFFVAACAASELTICCESMEDLKIYQHFASGTNPEAANCAIPR